MMKKTSEHAADPRHDLGLRGEALAEKFLRAAKMKFVTRRFTCPVGELDLVMHDGKTLVFVEVKSQTEDDWIDPEQRVTPAKQKRLVKAAAWLIHQRSWQDKPLRFDVVAVIFRRDATHEIKHLRDAFLPKRWA